ncbi:MAG: hypothetical protein IKS22_07140 [Bacteroidales bacterium]|nr:hypothetical protein [Bacteroidales bacterium]
MEHINFIYGKTLEGELITLDGFRVESYAVYDDEEEGLLVDLNFKSGNSVTVYAHVDEGSEVIDSLMDCETALRNNPDLLAKHFPAEFIGCNSSKNREFFFDGTMVEYYTQDEFSDEGLVELHFASGRVVEVFNNLDEEVYPGESIETLVDDCICRYFGD